MWKYYPVYRHLTGGLKRFLLNLPEAVRGLRSRQVLALKEISFAVSRGESIGIIGDNGAGKSTLLGLIAGVLEPSRGRIVVNGRVSALLELGAGFHPELTGRENVILNGVLLGLRRREVLRRMEAIIEFAELGEWIDQPTRTYSTGMVARLGFSVVAHLDPDILLIDEVLAVGDARFQQKCLAKMVEFKRCGVTIVLVSHALGDIIAICDRAIWIDDHQIAESGAAEEVVQAYQTKVGGQKPYFGPVLRACQGVPKRHAYMQALVQWLSKNRPGESLRVLEVGSWAGGSAITWAKAIRKYSGSGRVVCVDPWKPYFDLSVESDAIYIEMNRAAETGAILRLFLHNVRASGVHNLVIPIVGTSRDFLPVVKEGVFSIVYLDGSHLYADVAEDIRLAKSVAGEGAVICGDDLELQAFEVEPSELERGIRSGKDYVRDASTSVSYHPGVTLAVGEAFPAVSTWEGFWAVQKTAEGWRTIDLTGCEIEVPAHLTCESAHGL